MSYYLKCQDCSKEVHSKERHERNCSGVSPGEKPRIIKMNKKTDKPLAGEPVVNN